MIDKIDTSAGAITAIREKVRLFQRLGMPGQGTSMHMGTFYLVNDLDGLTKALAAERDRLRAALIWCSGSADFNEGGIAADGWQKLCAPLLKGDSHE